MQLKIPGALNMKRNPKVLILMLVIAVIGLSLLFVSMYSEMSTRIKTDRQTLMTQTADFLGAHIDEWLDKNIRVLKTAAIQPGIMSMDPVEQTEILQAIAQEYPWIYLVFTLDRHGWNIARSDHGPLNDYSDREYFKALENGSPLSWQTLIGKTSHKPALVLALPIFRKGIFAGVIAAAMTTETISRSVADWQLGVSGFAFLVDEQNKVIAHPRRQFVLEERRMPEGAFSEIGSEEDFYLQRRKGDSQNRYHPEKSSGMAAGAGAGEKRGLQGAIQISEIHGPGLCLHGGHGAGHCLAGGQDIRYPGYPND